MNKSIKRLLAVVLKGVSYKKFEEEVLKYPEWYLGTLLHWTKRDLKEFYQYPLYKLNKEGIRRL